MPLIEVVAPDPTWPQQFDAIAADLRHALGDLALAVEHIGSTAVPGLVAKDVIDVQVSVADLDDPDLRRRLEDAGYRWRDDIDRDHRPPGVDVPDDHLSKRYADERPGARRVHVHLRVPGRFNHEYALRCRDELRAHPEVAATYGEIKVQLAARFPDDVDSYYAIKDPVFDLIVRPARLWAELSPAPSPRSRP